MNKFELIKIIKQQWQNGTNITKFLQNMKGVDENSSEAIEIAYDLQAGTYIKILHENWDRHLEHNQERVEHLAAHLDGQLTFLDAGAGEFTNLTLYFSNTQIEAKKIYACDISWSRVHTGVSFWNKNSRTSNYELIPFVADFKYLPFSSSSIDVISTGHALEPNGGSLDDCLVSLFRVAKKRLVLFEPHYEIASFDGQQRMEKLGYIKGIEEAVVRLGGKVLDVTTFKTSHNPLNPISCFVIEPPLKAASSLNNGNSTVNFTVPGTEYPLVEKNDFMFSEDTGYAFPILEKIPILTGHHAILASSLSSS